MPVEIDITDDSIPGPNNPGSGGSAGEDRAGGGGPVQGPLTERTSFGTMARDYAATGSKWTGITWAAAKAVFYAVARGPVVIAIEAVLQSLARGVIVGGIGGVVVAAVHYTILTGAPVGLLNRVNRHVRIGAAGLVVVP